VSTTPEAPAGRLAPSRGEWVGLLLLLGAFQVFNLATCNYYPTVWCDEVWFAEPAVNLVRYGSFTTIDWQLQPLHTFPALNCPLYTMTLAPWLALTGTSVLAVRSFNYTLMTAAAFLCWWGAWRFNLVRSARLRLVMVAALYLGYGMSYSYRCSRPDIIGMVCVLLLAHAFQIRRVWLRYACLGTLGIVLVWIGLQVALFAGFASALAWLVLRRPSFKELVVLASSMAAGAAALAGFFASKGLLNYFLLPTVGILGKHYAHAPHVSASAAVLKVIRQSLGNYLEDFSLIPITLGWVVLLWASWKLLDSITRRVALYGMALTLAVPPVFNLIGHFAFYYSYMRFVPGLVAFFAVYSALSATSTGLKPCLRWAFWGTLAAAIGVGLPMRLALSPIMYQVAPRSEIRRMVREQVGHRDVVFTEQTAFFEAKQVTQAVYDIFASPTFLYLPMPGSREFTPEEKAAVSVLIIRPEQSKAVTNFFGGSWVPVTAPFGDVPTYQRLARVPVAGGRLVHYAEQPQNIRRQIQIFRRHGTAAEAAPAANSAP
jgi:hypothetical protein